MSYKKPDMGRSLAGRDRLPVTGTPFWKPPGGPKGKYQTTWIRILPLAEDDPGDEFYRLLPLHYGIGANNRVIICRNLSTEGVERCPICEAAREQFNRGNEEAGRELRATWRALVNMIVIDADEGTPLKDEEIQVWAMPKNTYLDLLDEIEKLPEDDRDITDPETGRDVYVDRKGSGRKDTEYKIGFSTSGAASFPAVELLEPDDALFNLAEVHTSYDADTVLAMLEGGAAGPDPFDGLAEGDQEPQAALPAPRNQRGAAPPEADADDEEEPTAEGPADEEAAGTEPEEAPPEPKRRASTRGRGRTTTSESGDAGVARERLRSATSRKQTISRNARPEAEGEDNE